MSRHHSHLNSTVAILSSYDGIVPFAQALKRFFADQKKYGSTDRRQIGDLCYCYFRALRILADDMSLHEKILLSHLLCTSEHGPFIETLKPEWTQYIGLSVEEKCGKFGLDFNNIFPNIEATEDSIDKVKFSLAHFIQPDLFLRIRPGEAEKVKQKLDKAKVNYQQLDIDCLVLPNKTKIEEHLQVNKQVVIQDYASQRVGKLLDRVKDLILTSITKLKVWDCCAASGGKSILAIDKIGPINLTVSDNRETILRNLKTRLHQANIRDFNCLNIDLTDQKMVEALDDYDLIIADVPCSGSGTWSRTPERLHQCSIDEINNFAALQKQITSNIQSKLKPSAFLLYITCSVYKQENSEIINHLISHHSLKLIESQMFEGYEHRSDTMYAALLQKS
ncbi:MAG: Fmu (Sun) domain-containing protein [Bacteroidetes bacterium HGW-Bacteroidetes-17]|nr:MAG: Fmu (Sun) domain-containing protein [Bacteroidetes bacterium HGW-Bacteroidetes-17]